jgi:hypothetical protein
VKLAVRKVTGKIRRASIIGSPDLSRVPKGDAAGPYVASLGMKMAMSCVGSDDRPRE